MSPTRVAITGIGVHTGHGDAFATFQALCEGRSALTLQHPWNWDANPFPAAPAPDPSPIEFLADRKSIKYMGPCTQMAVLAAGQALRDAGLVAPASASLRETMGLFVATGPIAFDMESALRSIGAEGASDLLALKQDGLRRCHPLLPFKMLLNMPLGLVSITFGIKGQNFILYPGAEQGAQVLAHALRSMRHRRLSCALVGGSAHTLSPSPLLALHRQGRLATSLEGANPFSANHQGLAPADQAAFLVLETEDHAHERGAAIYSFLDHTKVLGPDSLEHLWDSVDPMPDVIFSTGQISAQAVEADRLRAIRRWTREPTAASLDGMLGVAPAPSFLLAAAMACLAFREKHFPRSILASPSDRPDQPIRRVLFSFHENDRGAAVATLSCAEVSA